MADYISRERLIEKLVDSEVAENDRIDIGYNAALKDVKQYLTEMPTADVKEIRYGSWSNQVLVDDGFGGKRVGYVCSACKKFVPNKGNYCLECGADMRGDQNDRV